MAETFFVAWWPEGGHPQVEASDLDGDTAVKLAHDLVTNPDRPEVYGVWVVETENCDVQLSYDPENGLVIDRSGSYDQLN